MTNHTNRSEYLGCVVGSTTVGIPGEFVQEVFETREITRLPNSPGFVAGVVNVRGTIIPVLDLWKTMKASSAVKKVVILKTSEGTVGLLIGRLLDLVRFPQILAVEELPEELGRSREEFPARAARDGEVFYLADIEVLVAHTLPNGSEETPS